MNAFTIYGHGGQSLSCDLDHLYNLSFPYPRRLHKKIGFDRPSILEKKIFENGGHIHVYSPGAEADNTLGSNGSLTH